MMESGTSHLRVHFLPAHGQLLVSTDVHGNGEDFRRLRTVFLNKMSHDPDTHWAILGDIVHAPNPEMRLLEPLVCDYEDESWPIAREILDLQARYPGNIHFVLGNHDYAHIGGKKTRKFYPDEAAHLETQLSDAETSALHSLFRNALLAVVAPCGLFLAHGSPDDSLHDLDDLNRISFPPSPEDSYASNLVASFLTHYGQRAKVTERLLRTVSRSGSKVHLVVHGHDRNESGYFTEGGNQICPVIFGATRETKRFLQFKLGGSYRKVEDVREGYEIQRLYQEA